MNTIKSLYYYREKEYYLSHGKSWTDHMRDMSLMTNEDCSTIYENISIVWDIPLWYVLYFSRFYKQIAPLIFGGAA